MRGSASADRHGVHQAAFRPELVEAARQVEGGVRAEVLGPGFAVVADLLNNTIRPVLVEAEHAAHVLAGADQALHVGVGGRLAEFVDVRLRDAQLFGAQERGEGPAHDLEELFVTAAHGRTEGFLADRFGKDLVLRGILRERAHARKVGHVGRVDVAAARKEGALRRFGRVEDDRLVGHLVRVEVVGERLFRRRPGLHADRRAVQFLGALHVDVLRDDEALTVVVGDGDEDGALARVAGHRPGRIAREHVDFARLERREALGRGERHVLHLFAVAQNGGGDRTADVDVEPAPLALAVRAGEARRGGVDAAEQVPAGLDAVENGAGGGGSRGNCAQGRGDEDGKELHVRPCVPFPEESMFRSKA